MLCRVGKGKPGPTPLSLLGDQERQLRFSVLGPPQMSAGMDYFSIGV